MNVNELILSSLILKRVREMRGAHAGKTDAELIDIAIMELSSLHGEIIEKLSRQLGEDS